jgi:hypothetical protein
MSMILIRQFIFDVPEQVISTAWGVITAIITKIDVIDSAVVGLEDHVSITIMFLPSNRT